MYLADASPRVVVRLLAGSGASKLKPAVAKFVAQSRVAVEVRCSNAIDDRVLILEGRSCWVLGQSIKDAAKAKPTYLAPLDATTAQMKMDAYETIWNAGRPI